MTTKYKNIGGHHIQLDGTVVSTGSEFTDADDGLREKFPQKFEVLGKVEDVKPAPAPVTPPKELDVTDEFETQGDSGMSVIRVKAGWNIYDNDGDVINESPLKKKEVQPFIDEWIEE